MVLSVRTDAVRGSLPNLKLLREQVNYARRTQGLSPMTEAASRELLEIPDYLKVPEEIFIAWGVEGSLSFGPWLMQQFHGSDIGRVLP